MKRGAQFWGITGLVLVSFSVIAQFIVAIDTYNFIPIQFVIGLLCIIIFLLQGGFRTISSVTARRSTGFGFGLLVYALLFFGIVIGINYLASSGNWFRYDSTENKVFTLSPQSVDVLGNLREAIRIRAFYPGKKAPPPVEELLGRIAGASTKVVSEIIDPEQDIGLTEKLAIRSPGTVHISFADETLNRETRIENEISEETLINAILKLVRSGERIVYYLTGHDEPDLDDEKENGYKLLSEAIQGENIILKPLVLSGTEEIPSDASALLIAGPRKELLSIEVEKINKFLEKGGDALFLHEPQTSNSLRNIASAFGVEIGDDVIVDQFVQLFAGPSLGVQPIVAKYGKHAIVDNFNKNTLFSLVSSVSAVKSKDDGSILTELAFTSENSWAEKNVKGIFSETPTASLDSEDIKGPVPVAVAYERPISNGEGTGSDKNGKKLQRLVVIGDADFVTNAVINQFFNQDFFLNSLNWVIGEEQGVTIRARTLRRSMVGITSEQFSTIFLFTAILFPQLLLIWGLAVWWFRKH